MNNHIEKQYNRNLISSEDFLEAVGYLKALERSASDKTVYSALLIAAMISYCRPFTNNQGNQMSNPSVSQKFVDHLEHDEKKLHRKLMELRNKVFAHSDFDAKPCQRMPGGVAVMKDVDILKENINIKLFLKIADSMAAKCVRKNIELDRQHPVSAD